MSFLIKLVECSEISYCANNAYSRTTRFWEINLKRSKFKLLTVTFSFALLSFPKGDDFSNELPSSSSSSSLPSSPSLSSSPPSSSELPHSSLLPHPESPFIPVSPGNLRLEVAAPHYHEDQLQVKVFWKLPSHGELFLKYKKKSKTPEQE